MRGSRHEVVSRDGTRLGLLTAGAGPPLLLVHGGMAQREVWEGVWELLTPHCTVTALDRRGRGTSGAGEPYALVREHEDVDAVVRELADSSGQQVDVVGHSYGATVALGAAGPGSAVRRLALYEPPGPQALPRGWRVRLEADVAAGRTGPAAVAFLREVVGLSADDVDALRQAVPRYDVLALVATLPREARALEQLDVRALAAEVRVPVLLLLGEHSPPWAAEVSAALQAALPTAELRLLPGQGHEAVDRAPELVAAALLEFLGGAQSTSAL